MGIIEINEETYPVKENLRTGAKIKDEEINEDEEWE